MILNGMGFVGYIEFVFNWVFFGDLGRLLDIWYIYLDVIWFWIGFLGLYFRIKFEGNKF